MNDNQKWLEAAAGLEEDILYLKSALATTTSQAVPNLKRGIARLKTAVTVFRNNAAIGMRWPTRDDLFSIDIPSAAQFQTGRRRHFKTAN
jgi:hypothetical protein